MHSLSESACLQTIRTGLHQAWDRRDQRSGSFQEFDLLRGGFDRDPEHYPWVELDDRGVAYCALIDTDLSEGNAPARGLGRALVRSIRVPYRASMTMLVVRRIPDLYSRD
jgi:hypothetical protein